MNTPVSFKLAKLLKEKGFDLHTFTYYCNSETFIHSSAPYECKYNDSKNSLSAPTIAQVAMWLYEKHGIWVEANLLPNVNKFSFIAKPIDFKKPKEFSSYKEYYNATAKFISKEKFNSPTEAYEAAIEYTLNNLIK